MQEKIGIWIDKKQAFVIRLADGNSKIKEIESPLELYNPVGGHRSKTPWGPVDTVKEKAYMEKEKQQKKIFFENIIKEIGDSKYLFIFGPAQMKFEFKKYLDSKHGISPEFLLCETADSMTSNQMIAEVRGAFRHV